MTSNSLKDPLKNQNPPVQRPQHSCNNPLIYTSAFGGDEGLEQLSTGNFHDDASRKKDPRCPAGLR